MTLRSIALLVLALHASMPLVKAQAATLSANAAAGVLTVSILKTAPPIDPHLGGAWAQAAKLNLGMDFTYRRPPVSPTKVFLTRDKQFVDVAFLAQQAQPLTERQTTDGAGVDSDDYVGVYIFPQGTQGFQYSFLANPRGAHFQTSSENTSFTPQWTSVAYRTRDGYCVIMRIPLSAMRTGGSKVWKIQFVRNEVATGSFDVWTYSPNETSSIDPFYAGTVAFVSPVVSHGKETSSPRRLQAYALASTGSTQGSATSRMGIDLSAPVTSTASFVATLHPDYSNVEIDQQTIAPSAFGRKYAEVRPFFTQAASFFNQHFGCINCPVTLYAPAIPAFSQGYALEGTEGAFSFAGFDAIAPMRSDDAQTLNYSSENATKLVNLDVQRVSVNAPSIRDVVTTYDVGYLNQRSHFGAYANYGTDANPSSSGPSSYGEAGLVYVTATTSASISTQHVDAQFQPADGYVQQLNIYGYEATLNKTFNFAPTAFMHDIAFSGLFGRFRNASGALAQTDAFEQLNFDLRGFWSVHLFGGALGAIGSTGEFLPYDGNGFYIGYKGNTSTPTYVLYQGGPYYHGSLSSWSYVATLPLSRRIAVALEADENKYISHRADEAAAIVRATGNGGVVQWLERATLDWQISRAVQFDAGVRKITGPFLPNSVEPPDWSPIVSTNVSAALHVLSGRQEVYFAYGDPNAFSTNPTVLLKWITYIGADKGT